MISLATNIKYINIEMWTCVVIMILAIIPLAYNYIVVNVGQWWENVVYWWVHDFGFWRQLACLILLIMVAVVGKSWWFSFGVFMLGLFIALDGFLRMFDKVFNDIAPTDIDMGGKSVIFTEKYSISKIHKIYRLLDYNECLSCEEEIVREPMWRIRVRFEDIRARSLYICKRCAPGRHNVEEYLYEDLILHNIKEEIAPAPPKVKSVWEQNAWSEARGDGADDDDVWINHF